MPHHWANVQWGTKPDLRVGWKRRPVLMQAQGGLSRDKPGAGDGADMTGRAQASGARRGRLTLRSFSKRLVFFQINKGVGLLFMKRHERFSGTRY